MTTQYKSKLSLRALLLGAACVGTLMLPSAGYAACVINAAGDCQGSQQAAAVQAEIEEIVARGDTVEPNDLFGPGSPLIQGDDEKKNDAMREAIEKLKEVYENLESGDLKDALLGTVLSLAKEGAATPEAIEQLAANFEKFGTEYETAKTENAASGGGQDMLSLVMKTLASSLFGSQAQTLASGQFSPQGLFNQAQQAAGSVQAMDLSGYKDLGEDWPKDSRTESGEWEAAAATQSGKSRTYEGDDPENPGTNMVVVKFRETYKEASRAWVNNNPGNIQCGKFAARHNRKGCDKSSLWTDPSHSMFASPNWGQQARIALLTGKNYRNLSVAAGIAKYCPVKGGCKTQDYINKVGAAGVPLGKSLGSLNEAEMKTLLAAMRKHEGWNPGRIKVNRQAPAAVPKATVASVVPPSQR